MSSPLTIAKAVVERSRQAGLQYNRWDGNLDPKQQGGGFRVVPVSWLWLEAASIQEIQEGSRQIGE